MTTIRNKRLWLLALVLAVVAGLTSWLRWDRAHQPPPQIITLSDGSRYRFAGVTYGTKSVPPTLSAHIMSWLPAPVAKLVRRHLGTRIPQWNESAKIEKPRLFVWFEPLGTNGSLHTAVRHIYFFGSIAQLSDEAGVQAGMPAMPGLFDGGLWNSVNFEVVPKRSRMLQWTIDQQPATRITFPNPLYGHFAQWAPGPVPAMKQTGTLSVTLDRFENVRIIANSGRQTSFAGSLHSSPNTNESWLLHDAELSDATGNVLREERFTSSIFSSGGHEAVQPGKSGFAGFFQGTLWPDEAAWRLKLELIRGSGFAPGELVTFTNVPVPAMGTTNKLLLSRTAGSVQIVLTEFVHQPNLGDSGAINAQSRIKVELPAKPAGVVVDFLETMPPIRRQNRPFDYQSGSSCVFYLQSIPTNAQTMNLTFVVQKTRTVEFLVAPPKPK